jgi:hypothetical protein
MPSEWAFDDLERREEEHATGSSDRYEGER